MGLLFDVNEGINDITVLNKGKILKWYEAEHKNLIPMSELKMKKYSKVSANTYVPTDKYTIKADIKDVADPDALLGTEAINCLGYETKDEKLVFILEAYMDGVRKVGPAPLPKFIYKYIGINQVSKTHKGYYLNKIKQQLSLDDSIAASKFLKQQYHKMKNSNR